MRIILLSFNVIIKIVQSEYKKRSIKNPQILFLNKSFFSSTYLVSLKIENARSMINHDMD